MANPAQSAVGARQPLAVEYTDSRTMFKNAAQALQRMQAAVKEFVEAQTVLASLQEPAATTLAKMQAARPISEETKEVLQRQSPETARNYADHAGVAGKRTEKTAARVAWLKDVVAAAKAVPATLSGNLGALADKLAEANAIPTEVEPAEAYTGETYEAAYNDRVAQQEGAKTALKRQLEPVTTAATAAAALLEKVDVGEIDTATAGEELAGLAATLEKAQTTEAQTRKVLDKVGADALPEFRSHPEDSATMGAVWPGLETTFAEKKSETEAWRADLATRKMELEQQLQGFATVAASLKTSVKSLQRMQTRAVNNLTSWERPPGVVGGAVETVSNLMASEPLGRRMMDLLEKIQATVSSATEERAEELNKELTGHQAKIEGFKEEIKALNADRKKVGYQLLEKISVLVEQLQTLQTNGWKPQAKEEEAPKRKKILGIF